MPFDVIRVHKAIEPFFCFCFVFRNILIFMKYVKNCGFIVQAAIRWISTTESTLFWFFATQVDTSIDLSQREEERERYLNQRQTY